MSTLTIRLPDDTAQWLKSLAAWDTENHFRAMAATRDVAKAFTVLDRLDAADARRQELEVAVDLVPA